jgi:hypothetical protein
VPAATPRFYVYERAPLVQALRPEVPAKLSAVVDRLLRKAPSERFQTGDDLARVAGELRGRDFRAPPLLRAFVRNAQVSTLVLLASVLAGKGMGIIGAILLFQLVVVARRLLKDGYTFDDIRAALLAERQVQREEEKSSTAPLVAAAGRVVVPDLGRKSRTRVLLARGEGLKATARAIPSVDGPNSCSDARRSPRIKRCRTRSGAGRETSGVIKRLETAGAAGTGAPVNRSPKRWPRSAPAPCPRERQSGMGSPSDLTLVLEARKDRRPRRPPDCRGG